MPSYVYLQHYTSQGDLGLSRNVFVTLAKHVVSHVKENNKNKGIKISDNIDVVIRSNRVFYKFYITKTGNANTKAVEKSIFDYINSNVLMICEVVPFDISIKITSESENNE